MREQDCSDHNLEAPDAPNPVVWFAGTGRCSLGPKGNANGISFLWAAPSTKRSADWLAWALAAWHLLFRPLRRRITHHTGPPYP